VYRRIIERMGPAQAERQLGLRINVDRVPTRPELLEAARTWRLAGVHYTLPPSGEG
jgi:hypothetical protein